MHVKTTSAEYQPFWSDLKVNFKTFFLTQMTPFDSNLTYVFIEIRSMTVVRLTIFWVENACMYQRDCWRRAISTGTAVLSESLHAFIFRIYPWLAQVTWAHVVCTTAQIASTKAPIGVARGRVRNSLGRFSCGSCGREQITTRPGTRYIKYLHWAWLTHYEF